MSSVRGVETRAAALLRQEVAAALDALALVPLEPFDAPSAVVVIERVGDGLRLGLLLPSTIVRWLSSLPPPNLSAILHEIQDAFARQPVPTGHVPEDDPDLVLAVTARDRAESAKRGILRACIGGGIAPVVVPGFKEFLSDVGGFDAALSKVTTRDVAEFALGERRWMLADGDWTRSLPDPKSELPIVTTEERKIDFLRLPEELEPDTDAIYSYVVRGRCVESIEGWARRSPEFMGRLADTIDGLLESEEPSLSLVALRFRAELLARPGDASPKPHGPPVVRLPGWVRPRAFAAADAASGDEEKPELHLGRLFPVDAEARLLFHPDAIELRVSAPAGALRSVQFGETNASPDELGVWSARLQAPGTRVVHVVVESSSGQRFEVEIALSDSDP